MSVKGVSDKRVNEELVRKLEGVLEEARSGEIINIAIAMTLTNARTGNVYDATQRPMALLGELRCLERDIIDGCVDVRLHEAGEEY